MRPWFIKLNQKQQQQQNKQKNSKNWLNMVAHTCDPELGWIPCLRQAWAIEEDSVSKVKLKIIITTLVLNFLCKYFLFAGRNMSS